MCRFFSSVAQVLNAIRSCCSHIPYSVCCSVQSVVQNRRNGNKRATLAVFFPFWLFIQVSRVVGSVVAVGGCYFKNLFVVVVIISLASIEFHLL